MEYVNFTDLYMFNEVNPKDAYFEGMCNTEWSRERKCNVISISLIKIAFLWQHRILDSPKIELFFNSFVYCEDFII